MMASQLYSRYYNIVQPLGATYDENVGLIAIRSAQVARIPTIYIRLGKTKLPIIGE